MISLIEDEEGESGNFPRPCRRRIPMKGRTIERVWDFEAAQLWIWSGKNGKVLWYRIDWTGYGTGNLCKWKTEEVKLQNGVVYCEK